MGQTSAGFLDSRVLLTYVLSKASGDEIPTGVLYSQTQCLLLQIFGQLSLHGGLKTATQRAGTVLRGSFGQDPSLHTFPFSGAQAFSGFILHCTHTTLQVTFRLRPSSVHGCISSTFFGQLTHPGHPRSDMSHWWETLEKFVFIIIQHLPEKATAHPLFISPPIFRLREL